MNESTFPADIDAETELATIYAEELKEIKSQETLVSFIERWDYWLDAETKALKFYEWEKVKTRIDSCRFSVIENEDNIIMSFLVPYRLLKVSLVASKFGVPWGCAYLQMKEAKTISF